MADSRTRRYLSDDAFDHVVPVPSLPYVEPDRTKRVGDHAQHIPTPFSRRQVSLMVAIGMSHQTICWLMNVSMHTLRDRYMEELRTGQEIANMHVAMRVYDDAVNTPGPTGIKAAELWLDRRGGLPWKSNATLALTGPNGEALGTNGAAEPLTFEQRARKVAQILASTFARGIGPVIDDSDGTLVTEPGPSD